MQPTIKFNNASKEQLNAISPKIWSLALIQEIEWKKFEELSAAYYQEKGIRAEETSLGADGGIDIKLYQDNSGSPTSLVQCKAWTSKQVGVKEIREFLGVMTHEKITKGFYMTSGEYSTDAKNTAIANKITLINGQMLLEMIKRLPVESQQKLLALATMGDYRTPTCSSCGVKMLVRGDKSREFWGCANYPKCRQKLNIKKVERNSKEKLNEIGEKEPYIGVLPYAEDRLEPAHFMSANTQTKSVPIPLIIGIISIVLLVWGTSNILGHKDSTLLQEPYYSKPTPPVNSSNVLNDLLEKQRQDKATRDESIRQAHMIELQTIQQHEQQKLLEVQEQIAKEDMWKRYYKKSPQCEALVDVVTCGNEYIVNKKKFEIYWENQKNKR